MNLQRRIVILMLQPLAILAVTLLLLPLGNVIRAQTSLGRILGRVSDQSGAVVPNAQVTLRNEGTNVTTTAQTNTAGEYVFSNLTPGSYEIRVTAKGFKAYVISHIQLSVDQTVRQDATLNVGSSTTSVRVTAQLPIVQTDTTSVGSVIDSKQISMMPLNGRTNIFGLLALSPGVQSSGSNARIAGSAWRGGYSETIDGASNAEPENERLAHYYPSLDSIGEFKVIDSSGSAKYGSGQVAVILSTKSGTNQFHGSAFEYNRVAALEAANFFATGLPKAPFVRNEFGGSLGGPIKRDKAFFFASYEGLTFRTSSTNEGAMPTAALLNGDFSGLPAITNPQTGLPFLDNQIPSSQISSAAKALFPYFDSPNLPTTAAAGLGTNWIGNVGTQQDNNRYEGRADYNINQKNILSARYYNVRLIPNYFGGSTDKWGGVGEDEVDQNLAVNYTHIVASNLVNLATFGWFRISPELRIPQNYTLDPSTLIPGLPKPLPGLGGLPTISITGFSGLNDNTGSGGNEQTYGIKDDLTWVKGKHTFDAGFSYNHWGFLNFQNPTPGHGSFSFTGRYTGNPFADFLLGYLSADSRPISSLQASPANHRFGFYFQDSWKTTSRLTLNWGVRYDLPSIYQIVQGNMSNWYPNLNEIVILKGQNTGLFPTLPIVEGSSVGLNPGNWVGNDLKQVAPRFGFAYRPLGSTRLVVRGGYGLYYMIWPWANGPFSTAVNPPFTGIQSFEPSPGPMPTLTFANAFPSGSGTVPAGVTINAYPAHYRYPMSQEWNMTLESQISPSMSIRASYLGVETEHLNEWFNLNDPTPAPGAVQPRRPYQPFGAITYNYDGQTSNTQMLQLSALRRFSKGLSFEAEYAWTKTLDSGPYDCCNYPTDNRNIRLDRGNDANTRHQYLVANYVYELPVGKGKHFLSSVGGFENAILGGWQTSGILTLGSGLPYSVTFTSSVQGWPSSRADIVGDPSVSNPSLTQWFNPAAYVEPQPFTFGNSAPYSLFGPGYSDWDMSFFKDFRLNERFTLRFRSDWFNTFNHPSFGNPDSNISVPTQVGQIFSTSSSPRSIQFALRLSF